MFGEFSSKFAEACAAAPHLERPDRHQHRRRATTRRPWPTPTVDLYALTHNETSTGVAMELRRPAETDGALVAVDATSGAGGLPWDPAEVDVYYFAPQKCFASDGGLWVAACSPAAVERIERLAAIGPLASGLARPRDRARRTAASTRPTTRRRVATLFLFDDQLRWMIELGRSRLVRQAQPHVVGPPLRLGRGALVGHAVRRPIRPSARPSSARSTSTTRIDADEGRAALRANGIVDTDSYRKLGRNQLRIGMFPAIDPADVEALTACIDHLVEQHPESLSSGR